MKENVMIIIYQLFHHIPQITLFNLITLHLYFQMTQVHNFVNQYQGRGTSGLLFQYDIHGC